MRGRPWFQSVGSSGTRVEFRAGGQQRDVPVPGPIERAAAAIVRWLEDLEERCAARRWERGRVVDSRRPGDDGVYRYKVTRLDGAGAETPIDPAFANHRRGAVTFTLMDGAGVDVVPDDVASVETVLGGGALISVVGRGDIVVKESASVVSRRLTSVPPQHTKRPRGSVSRLAPVYRNDRGLISVAGRELEPAPACPTCDKRMRAVDQKRWFCCGGQIEFVHDDRLTRSAPPVRRRLVDDAMRCACCKAYIRLADRSCPLCRRVFDPNTGIEIVEVPS